MNEQGDKWAYFVGGYDKLRSIESFEGSLFDAAGKKLKSLKKSDIKDVSGSDDASLADDNRVKWHSFFYKVYPYTVEYEVEIRYKGTMFCLTGYRRKNINECAAKPSDCDKPRYQPLRYKMFNYNGEPVITEEKSNKIYTWEVKDMPAVTDEYASPAWPKITTSVFMATEKFVLEDYQGSNASWKDFGKFVYDLKKNRDVLPDDVKQKVHQLTDGITDVNEKIRKLYEYMQQNTRYISVQLGIGGWQPFDAKYVGTKKYGDCKALSNFMYSLLKEAGIRSVYTVINAEDDDDYLLTDLPCSQFNHVILFVPNGKDTTWLECTSQTKAAGYLGGIGNRYAVAVDENGGSLVRTPKYGVNENLEIRHSTATIDETGNLEALIKTKYMAEQQDRLHAVINGLSKDKLMEFLKEDIELATYDVKSFNYKEEKSLLFRLLQKHWIWWPITMRTVSGKRFFVVPNMITRTHRKIKEEENRKNELLLDFEFKDMDTSEINIPAGYTPESIPQDAKIESKFGKYSASVKVVGDRITYYRIMNITAAGSPQKIIRTW